MRIIKYLTVFLISLLLADQGVNLVLERLYAQTMTGQSGGKVNYLLKNFDHLSTLSIGNSRCAHHVIPEVISDQTYNLSHNGMTLIYHVGLIDQLLRYENIQIDTILLHLEREEIFGEKKNAEKDIQHLKYFYNKNPWIQKKISGLSRFEFIKYFFSTYKWNGKVMSVVNNWIKSQLLNAPPPPKGYVSNPPSGRDSINVSWDYQRLSKIRGAEPGEHLAPEFKDNIEYLNALCKEKKITLICFTSPVYQPVLKNRNAKMDNYFKNLSVPFLNFYDINDDDFQSIWLWKDTYHLNSDGALLFSKILRRDLNQLLAEKLNEKK